MGGQRTATAKNRESVQLHAPPTAEEEALHGLKHAPEKPPANPPFDVWMKLIGGWCSACRTRNVDTVAFGNPERCVAFCEPCLDLIKKEFVDYRGEMARMEKLAAEDAQEAAAQEAEEAGDWQTAAVIRAGR